MSIWAIMLVGLPIVVTVGVIAYIVFEKIIIYGLYLFAVSLDKLIFKLRKRK